MNSKKAKMLRNKVRALRTPEMIKDMEARLEKRGLVGLRAKKFRKGFSDLEAKMYDAGKRVYHQVLRSKRHLVEMEV